MVTQTRMHPPHALFVGWTPAMLWIGSRLLTILSAVVPILLLPVLGQNLVRHNSYHPAVAGEETQANESSILLPNEAALNGILIVFAAMIVVYVLQKSISRALSLRIPGQLQPYSVTDPLKMALKDRIPNIVFLFVMFLAESSAALYAATHAGNDHGVTALILTLMGAVYVTIFVFRAGVEVVKRLPGWTYAIVLHAAGYLFAAIVFFRLANVAPHGELASILNLAELVMLFGVGVVVYAAFRVAMRVVRPATGFPVSEEIAEVVLPRVYGAPTLAQRKHTVHATRWILWGVVFVLIVGFVLGLLVL